MVAAVVLVLAGKAATLLDAVRLQGGDRPHVGSCRAFGVVAGLVARLRHGALRRRAVGQSSQCPVRKGRAGCRAAACGPGLPPHPRPQPALPPGTAHRLPDQDRRARHEEHRHDALFPAVQHRADADRAHRHLHHLLRQVRRRAGRGNAGHRRHLHRLHAEGDRLARADPAPDERCRQQGDRPRGRLAAQLRDGQIFRRRGARGGALR